MRRNARGETFSGRWGSSFRSIEARHSLDALLGSRLSSLSLFFFSPLNPCPLFTLSFSPPRLCLPVSARDPTLSIVLFGRLSTSTLYWTVGFLFHFFYSEEKKLSLSSIRLTKFWRDSRELAKLRLACDSELSRCFSRFLQYLRKLAIFWNIALSFCREKIIENICGNLLKIF